MPYIVTHFNELMLERVSILNFNEYQELAARTDNTTGKTVDSILTSAVMGMVGEAAEAMEHVKKYIEQDHKLDRDKLIEEAGDTLWYIAKLARVCGISLEELAKRNIEKLERRYPNLKFEKERSVNRVE